MSNFRYRLRESAKQLAVGEGDVKNRVVLAVTNHLLLANFPDDPEVPHYFREKHRSIIVDLSKKQWNDSIEDDRIRATIHRSRFKTISKVAERIWDLYNEYEEYLRSGFIPEENS